jgi:hypothetical protein
MDHLDPTRQPPARDALVAALRTRGIGFFAPSDAYEGPNRLSSRQLIAGLAGSPDARLRDGLAALVVRHPELAPEASITLGMLDAAAAEVLRVQYTAAACLQRMWRTTLALYLPVMPKLPDLFGAELVLPPLDEQYGEWALRELAARARHNQLAAWYAVIEQLLAQLAQEAYSELAAAG